MVRMLLADGLGSTRVEMIGALLKLLPVGAWSSFEYPHVVAASQSRRAAFLTMLPVFGLNGSG